ncbi:MAG: glutathione S-transferase [Rhodospirillaceae bacterium]|nr:glutathione S-transferase [Rhodospirillaceae bacterium]
MLTVWGRTTSINVQKVMWTVADLNLPHRRIDAGGKFGGLDTPAFKAMNPHGLVPVIDDGGLIVWESHAIVRYLAARYGDATFWPPDAAARAPVDQWMEWAQTTLQRDLIDLFIAMIRTAPAQWNRPLIDAKVAACAKNFTLLNDVLATRAFASGPALTYADIPIAASLYRYFEMEIARPQLPHVEAWYARLQQRPAYRAHVMVSFEELRAR